MKIVRHRLEGILLLGSQQYSGMVLGSSLDRYWADLKPGLTGETQGVRRVVTQKSKTGRMDTQLHHGNR